MDVQFELPSRHDVTKCVVTRESIEKGQQPILVTDSTHGTINGPHASEDDIEEDFGEQTA